jgi:DNA-binding MarR family transcriptional regulator
VSTEAETERDHVDEFLDSIKEELPTSVDLTVEGIVDRIGGINRRIKKTLDETLAEHGLTLADWRVLGALRWAGAPYRRSAGDLARGADLSSGAMTNRLDRMEAAGLVRRQPDPDDRRGVKVELTEKGMRLWQESVGVQARKEALLASALSQAEKERLNALLRRLVLAFAETKGEPAEHLAATDRVAAWRGRSCSSMVYGRPSARPGRTGSSGGRAPTTWPCASYGNCCAATRRYRPNASAT